MTTTLNAADYYLLANPNGGAKLRTVPASVTLHNTTGTGVVRQQRGHWYATRLRPIDGIALHTSESLPDYTDWAAGRGDGGAESVARYLATTDVAASYHVVVDADSRLQLLPDSFTAFHVVDFNSRLLGLSFATQAHQWPTAPDAWRDAIIENGAIVAAAWCVMHNLKPEHITKNVLYAGGTGILTHGHLDPARRTDPGAGFPWALFLERVRAHVHKAIGKHPAPQLDQPMCFVDWARDPATGGSWWLVADGGIANMGGAPYCGHLLDPRTQAILQQALGTTDRVAYNGKPVAIRANTFGGYTIWTDQGASYAFHPGTV